MLARRRARKEAAEGEVRAARDRAEVSEVNHRVANRLALVASFVNLQKNAVSDRVAKNALEETQARIRARRGRLV
jgi:two-component sensor histidine kinase